MDHRLVRAEARGRRAEGLLHSGESARRTRGGQLRPLPARHQDSAQGDQGRLAPVRAELLPALSPGRAPRAAGRHVHQPRRVSVRQPTGSDSSHLNGEHHEHESYPKSRGTMQHGRAVGWSGATCCSAAARCWPRRRYRAIRCLATGAGTTGAGDGPTAEHRRHHGRRHRHLEHRRLPPRHDGRADAEPRQASPPKACCSPTTTPRRAARRAAPTSSPASCRSAPA